MWDNNAGTPVNNDLGPMWKPQVPGSGVAGKVDRYEKRKGKKDGESYYLVHLTGAVTHNPREAGKPGTAKLYRYPTLAHPVGTWVARILEPRVTPEGSYIALTFVGTEGNAKKYELRLVDRDYLARLWQGAEDAPADAAANVAAPTGGDDDLPF